MRERIEGGRGRAPTFALSVYISLSNRVAALRLEHRWGHVAQAVEGGRVLSWRRGAAVEEALGAAGGVADAALQLALGARLLILRRLRLRLDSRPIGPVRVAVQAAVDDVARAQAGEHASRRDDSGGQRAEQDRHADKGRHFRGGAPRKGVHDGAELVPLHLPVGRLRGAGDARAVVQRAAGGGGGGANGGGGAVCGRVCNVGVLGEAVGGDFAETLHIGRFRLGDGVDGAFGEGEGGMRNGPKRSNYECRKNRIHASEKSKRRWL